MRILVMDTAFRAGRIGLCIDGRMTAEMNIEEGKLESRTFVLLMKIGIKPDLADIDLIALAGGPGSFTGLKIGAMVAKSLSFLQGTPFKAAGTLPWLSEAGGRGILLPVIKSHADRYYWGMYDVKGDGGSVQAPSEIIPPKCTNAEKMVDIIRGSDVPEPDGAILFSGDPTEPELPWPKVKVNLPLADLAELARIAFESEGPDDPLNYSPLYVARSQAEEKAEGKS